MKVTPKQLRYLHGNILPPVIIICTFAGMMISRSLLSSGMIAIAVYALILHDPRKVFGCFITDPVLIGLTIIFFLYTASGILSADTAYWKDRTWMKLPFLFLPVASCVFKNQFSQSQFNLLLFTFLLLVTITSAYYATNLYIEWEQMKQAYQEGRTMETPYSHVRYSLIVAFAIIAGIVLMQKKFYIKWKWERWVVGLCIGFLIYFIHLLAVRSGMVAFYLCLLFIALNYLYRRTRITYAMLLMVLIVGLPVVAYKTIPTIKSKVNYMKYDLSQYFHSGNASGLSDAGRIISIRTGIEIIKEHPLFGVGTGDLKTEMRKKLERAPENPKTSLLPHNQFVFVGAATGIFGMVLFVIIMLVPLIYRRNFRNPLMVCFHIILLSSFLTEATIEEQVGTALYIVFVLLLHSYLNPIGNKEKKIAAQQIFGWSFLNRYFGLPTGR